MWALTGSVMHLTAKPWVEQGSHYISQGTHNPTYTYIKCCVVRSYRLTPHRNAGNSAGWDYHYVNAALSNIAQCNMLIADHQACLCVAGYAYDF